MNRFINGWAKWLWVFLIGFFWVGTPKVRNRTIGLCRRGVVIATVAYATLAMSATALAVLHREPLYVPVALAYSAMSGLFLFKLFAVRQKTGKTRQSNDRK